MKAHHTSNPWTYLEVKRSKVKVTRPINAVRDNAAYGDRREFPRRKGESESILGRGHNNFLKIALFCYDIKMEINQLKHIYRLRQ